MKTLATISNKWIFLELCFGLLEINSLSITFHRTQALFSGSGVESFPFSCYSVQFSSVTQSCLILCNPMDCSRPGFPVHHQLPELAQTYVHWVGDAIQPSHPLSSLSPPAFNLSQHQMSQFFTSGSQSIGSSASASVLPMNIQDWFPLRLTAGIWFS